jgi:hypothetical protein
MFILGYKCEEQSDKDLVSGDEKKWLAVHCELNINVKYYFSLVYTVLWNDVVKIFFLYKFVFQSASKNL